MMVDLGKEKPSNDKKGHHGWYLPGSTWKRIERAVRKTWRSLNLGTEVPEGLVGRIKDTVKSPRSSGPPGPEQTWPPALGPCTCLGRRSVTALSFLAPWAPAVACLGFAQTWGFRSGVEALLCPHLWRRRPREAEAGASKASGRAGVRLSQKEGKARPLRVKRFIRKDLEPSWLDLQGYLKGRSRMVVGYNLPRESTLKEERVCIG